MAEPVDKPPTDLPIAPNGEVKAYDRLGNQVTVPKEKIGELYGMGGRVAKKDEVAAQQLDDDYAKKSTLEKAAGYATPALPAPVQMALRGAGVAPMPPELEAYRAGASQSFSGGLEGVLTKEGVELAAGKEAAHAFGQSQLALKQAHEGLYQGGELAGFIAGAVSGGGGKAGLGRAGAVLPSVGIGMAGGLAEQGAARVLGGVAAKGTIGRAIATGGELAARGAVEGALYTGADQVSEAMLGDHELAADKVFAAMGTGALYGGLGGGLLGGAGSLAASGTRAVVGAAGRGIGRALSKGEEAATSLAGRAEDAAADATARGKAAAEGAVTDAKGAIARTASEATEEAGKAARFAAEQTGTKVEQEIGSLRGKLGEMSSKDTQKAWANEQAWKAIGAGNGLQSASFAKSAERYLPNGVKDVGEVILRKGIINVQDGIVSAARNGTPAAMLPKIEAELAITGQKLGDMTAASPARIKAADIERAINAVAQPLERNAATEVAGKSVRDFGERLKRSMGIGDYGPGAPGVGGRIALDESAGIAGKFKTEPAFAIGTGETPVGLRPNAFASSRSGASEMSARRPISLGRGLAMDADAGLKPSQMRAGEEASDIFRMGKTGPADVSLVGGDAADIAAKKAFSLEGHPDVPLQELLLQRKALDRMVFDNAALDPSMQIAVKRELRSKLEGLIMDSLDAASGKLPGHEKAAYKALKHDYTALSIASDAAEDSAARMAKGATFGLTDTLRGGGSVIKTIGSKLVRERGNAAAAVLLSRMADMGTITRAVQSVDEHIGRAAAGVLAAPRKASLPSPASSVPVAARAETAMRRWAEVAANPEQTATRAAAVGEGIQGTAPMLAGALSQRMTSAAAFMVSKMPSVPDPDPFDPHPRPMLTDAQAAEYAAYDHYAEKPTRFFEEAAHGKLTFEGVEVARALMPGAFAEMQQRTLEGLTDLMAKKSPPPYLARQRLGTMLGVAAVPEQRPDHLGFLQKNVIGSEKPGQASAIDNGASAPKRPLPTKPQSSSTLDRLEGK